MPAFLVEGPNVGGTYLPDGVTAMVVFAENSDGAKEICKAEYSGDSDQYWAAATVTQLVEDADFEGWTFEVDVVEPDGSAILASGAVQSTYDTADSLNELGELMATALNENDNIGGASWSSPTLRVAQGSGNDDLGDKKVLVRLYPPDADAHQSHLIGTVTDEGSSTADLSVALEVDAARPQVLGKFRRA